MATLEGAFPGGVGSVPAPSPAAGSPGGRAPDGGILAPPPLPAFAPAARGAGGGGAGPSLELLLPRSCGGRSRIPSSCRKRHKMEEEPEGCPMAKKRLVEEVGLGPLPPGRVDWALCGGHPTTQALSCLPGPPELPCEEMEQVTVEPQCEAARRRLQEIEDRIIDDEEEEDGEQGEAGELSGSSGSSLPTLVLSDTLKTGLKQDYDGILPKKIIECMSRPSMELVLWRPLREWLSERSEPLVTSKSYKVAERGLAKPEPLPGPFLSQAEEFAKQPPVPAEMPSALLYHTGEPSIAVASPAGEEEMEL